MFPALEKSRELLEALPLPAYVWHVRSEKFLLFNERLCALLECSPQEIYDLDWRDLVVPGLRQAAETAVQRGGHMEAVRWYWKSKSGRIFPVVLSSNTSEFRDESGQVHPVRVTVVIGGHEHRAVPAENLFKS